MAENVIIAEDGSLIPTGDTQVEQVGEDTYDADTADSDPSTIVGGADSDDTFALEGDRVFDSGNVVSDDEFDGAASTTSTDTPSSTSDGVGESVRQVIVPSQSSGGLPTGLLSAGLAAVAVLVVLLGGGD